MKILLTGTSGQVGYELQRSLQGLGDVVAADRARIDLSNLDQVRQVISDVHPDIIVNPAAYTAVDRAEAEPELARTINALAPAVMAEQAERIGAALVHFSTDYVFDGRKESPYLETDEPNPLNVYGRTKLEGERLIAASGVAHLILRTSWVYGMRGSNFFLTMRRLGRERNELRVVNDQHGAPTWSRTIADVTTLLLAQSRQSGWWKANSGIYHLTAQGRTTWYEFAEAIMKQDKLACRILPIETADYPTPARRPRNSSMDTRKLSSLLCKTPHWREALELCIG